MFSLANFRRAIAVIGAVIGIVSCVTAFAQSSAPAATTTAKATFAGGCFWCVESDFDKIDGVISTTSGYIGGKTANPTYETVSSKATGHAEAVEIVFDPKKVSYEKLVEYFWRDKGSPYRTAIFAHDEAQMKVAKNSRDALEKTKPFKAAIVTEIVQASVFYPAETYHQDYYTKNPVRYKYYRTSCGRDSRLKDLWGDMAGKVPAK
jgi:peptide-methionine (S)-S-oxide reductase